MDTFVPPGYVTVTNLLQSTGAALLKEEWLGAVESPEDVAIRRAVQRKEHAVKAWRAATLRGGDPEPAPPSADLMAKLQTLEEARKRREQQRDQVIARLRAPLCTGAIAAVLKLPTGQLFEIPAYFWRGDDAVGAFLLGTATIGRYTGQVLFDRTSTEAWLQEARGAIMRMITEDEARDWLVARAESGLKFAGANPMGQELRDELNGTIPRERFNTLRKTVMEEYGIPEPPPGRPPSR